MPAAPPSSRRRCGGIESWALRLSHARQQDAQQVRDFNAFLLHGVAFAERDGVRQLRAFFAERVEINRDAEWRADFVLAAIAPANGAGFVVENGHVRPQEIADFLRFLDEFGLVLEQWEYGDFDGRDTRV